MYCIVHILHAIYTPLLAIRCVSSLPVYFDYAQFPCTVLAGVMLKQDYNNYCTHKAKE